jgi:hypothetical protein
MRVKEKVRHDRLVYTYHLLLIVFSALDLQGETLGETDDTT